MVTVSVTETSPVDSRSDEDEGIHAFCAHTERTWCGQDSRQHQIVSVPDSVDAVCRMCLLAVEMWAGGSCPVCGCASCLK